MHRAHYRVYVEVAHLVLVVPALVIGAKVHGIVGVATAVVLVNLATGLPVLVVLMRMLRVSARELVVAIGRPAIGWALMTAALAAVAAGRAAALARVRARAARGRSGAGSTRPGSRSSRATSCARCG